MLCIHRCTDSWVIITQQLDIALWCDSLWSVKVTNRSNWVLKVNKKSAELTPLRFVIYFLVLFFCFVCMSELSPVWGFIEPTLEPLSPPVFMQLTFTTARCRRGEAAATAESAYTWPKIWEDWWTFEADLFGKQSIKGFHYSVLQRGHSLSLYNGILIHMHLPWHSTKSIVWRACSLLPGINNSLRNMVWSIDLAVVTSALCCCPLLVNMLSGCIS